jgi:hypothetical protein
MAGERIYENPRAWRARIAQLAVWILAAVMVWLAVSENQVDETMADRIALWFGLIFGLACLVGIEVFLRRYVTAIDRAADGLSIETLATVHRRRVVVKGGSLGGARRDELWLPGTPSVNNQWTTISAPGLWMPLVVDVTPPAKLNRALMEAALRGKSGRGDGRKKRR